MSFLIDINPTLELPSNYKLMLCKSNEEPIGSLKHISNLKVSTLFVGIDNLSFDVPLNLMSNDGAEFRNRVYDLIEGDYLIKVNDDKYFTIVNVKESASSDGKKYKEIECKSREYELINKKLVDYKADSRKLYDPSNEMSEGLEIGILNYVFEKLTKSWTLYHVDSTLKLREGKGIYRSLNFSNSNLLQVFSELQKIYGCVFFFDTKLRRVSVYSVETIMGEHRGMYISNMNFIKSITKTIDSEGIVTRLFIRGKDGISIQSITPTGQPYLDNFDFYAKPKYMSEGLIAALNAYKTKVTNYDPDFAPIYVRLSAAKDEAEALLNKDSSDLSEKGLVSLKRSLAQVQILIDGKVAELAFLKSTIATAESTELEALYTTKISIEAAMSTFVENRVHIKSLIETKETEINNINIVIKAIEEEISNLQENLKSDNPNNFTEDQLRELDSFIKVETYNDTNFTENNLVELKEEGIRQLNRLSQPKIQFSVDVIDFLSLIECQHVWKKFVLGDLVILEHKEMGIRLPVRLVGYDHSPESNSLNLKFSNTNSYDDATLYERDLADQSDRIANTVDFESGKWSDIGNVESKIAKMVDSKLEEAKQNLLDAVGQKHLFDDSGFWLYKENPDGTINKEQIRAINNTIALTENNWQTVGTAITPRGLVADSIYGKIGSFATIDANQISISSGSNPEVGYSIVDYIKDQTDELDRAIIDFGGIIETAFSDGVITNIEVNSLQISHANLIKEANDIKAIAIAIDVSVSNLVTDIDSLNTEIAKHIGSYEYPKIISGADRTLLQSSFVKLRETISKVYEDVENKKNAVLVDFINQETGQLSDALDLLDSEIDKSFNDEYITNIEANLLKISLISMKGEALDVINIADKIDLVAATERINCNNALTELETEINRWINKPIESYPIEILPADRAAMSSKLNSLKAMTTLLISKIEEKRKDDLSGAINGVRVDFKVTTDAIIARVESINTDLDGKITETKSEFNIAIGAISSRVEKTEEDIVDISAHSIMLENENQSIVTNVSGSTKEIVIINSRIDVFKGTNRIDAILETPIIRDSTNQIITETSITKSNPTKFDSGSIVWTIPQNTNLPTDSGWIDIPMVVEGISYSKKLSWNKAKDGKDGTDGRTPVKGTDYFDGIDGQDGTSNYIWIKYSSNADGTGFGDTLSTYMGVATTTTSTPPALKSAYKWSKVVGTDGTIGETGPDGKTSYLHVKYSDNGTSFTGNNGETVGVWIGTYVDFIEADSDVFSKYTWNKVRGDDAKLLYLSSTSETITFNGKGVPNPATQTISITANLQNIIGTASFTAIPYSASGASLPAITLGSTGNTRTLTQAQWLGTYARMTITATLGGLSDVITIVKLQDGSDGAQGSAGKDAVVGYLTNESATLPASSTGTVSSYIGGGGTFKIFDGLVDKTGAGVSYTMVTSTGIDATISSTTGIYSVLNMTSDTATVEFRAVYSGITITKIMTLAKSRAGSGGAPGAPGAPARVVDITPSGTYFTKKLSGTNYIVTPDIITLTPDFKNCTYSKWEYSTDGSNWTPITRVTTSTALPFMDANDRILTIPKAWSVITSSDYVVFKATSTTNESDIQTVSILYDVGQLESRVYEAEQKITPEAITNTVSGLVSKPLLEFRYIRHSLKRAEESAYCYWGGIEVYANGVNIITPSTVVEADFTPTSGAILNYVSPTKSLNASYSSGSISIWRSITVDLGGLRNDIDSLAVYHNSSNRHYYEKIEVSKNKIDWYAIYNYETQGTYLSNYTTMNLFVLSTAGMKSEISTIKQTADSVNLNFTQLKSFTNGQQLSGGNTLINASGIKVTHTGLGGQYSEMRADGFVRKYPNGEAAYYMNNLYVATIVTASPGVITTQKPNDIIHYLPLRFKGQTPSIIPVVKSFVTDWYDWEKVSNSRAVGATSDIIVEITESLNASTPYLTIEGYVKNFYTAINQSYNQTTYSGLEIVLLIMMA